MVSYPSMEPLREVQPLSYTKRRRTFFFLLAIFVVSLPFLYLYATGYRFDPKDPNAIVGTGGIYVAAERTGAEIYIDDELVRETRVFRTAFYAQNLEPKTHRVHVQKEGHHTWVKELPVTSHRVTEAQAFNMPVIPQLRVISEFTSATGSAIVKTPLVATTTSNVTLATTTKATSTFSINPEYQALIELFRSTSTLLEEKPLIKRVQDEIVNGTTTPELIIATSTRVSGGVRLARAEDAVYAEWVGSFEQMPYYYCAAVFPRYSSSTTEMIADEEEEDTVLNNEALLTASREEDATEFVHPIQQVEEDTPCDRRVKIDPQAEVLGFEFFPGSTDFVIVELTSGIYVMEIDARAWQNLQPLLLGENLQVHIENGGIYVYDGALIYQVILDR
jgi:PEGA domain